MSSTAALTRAASPSLIQASDGNVYGMTGSGGSAHGGTVFKLTATGTLTTLYAFDCSTGSCGPSGLLQARDGNFYGTTASGGTGGAGTFFKLTAAGIVTTLRAFDCHSAEGCDPSGLIQASDGNFYGMMRAGPATVVFKLTPSGSLSDGV